MSDVTRDVVLDLLPVYLAGEASRDTRQLVEEYIRNDPELAVFQDARDWPAPELGGNAERPAKNMERNAFVRTRSLIQRRSWLLAAALLCTVLPFTFAFQNSGITFFMARDVPGSRGLWLAAALLWFAYLRLHNRLRTSEL